MPEIVYLSRRKLNTLLSKLDRKLAGDTIACSVIKSLVPEMLEHWQSMKEVQIIAVDDSEYYSPHAPPPGKVHPSDVSNVQLQRSANQ